LAFLALSFCLGVGVWLPYTLGRMIILVSKHSDPPALSDSLFLLNPTLLYGLGSPH
jgi:hypothetical protein